MLLTGLALTLPPGARAASASVTIGDGFFSPPALTIAVGDTVTWTNTDDSPHTVTAGGGAFDSGNVDPGATFSFTFTEPGTYSYLCRYHEEMQATIIVTPATGAAPTSESPTNASPATGAQAAAGASPANDTDQPDTALPVPAPAARWMPGILIGLGLVAFAFAVFPTGDANRPRRATGRTGGWRR
ncbi:MAG TPA: cupredoxin family copper-binding protein [Candidatus Limnocylindria bacterium]|nr:cupredoxin family copper-binding protein [Candidatus Limnocylindria bacterium]